jgi:peptide deformylase
MALRKVFIFPDPVLREKARPVTRFDDELKRLASDMLETMYASKGIGLAAPQVGQSLRLCVIDVADQQEKGEERKPVALVNPEIVLKEGEIEWNEGCLSFPGIYENIRRAGHVVVKALDVEGKPFTIEGLGLLAVAMQHEIDHLEGILIFDYMSFIRKKLVKRELKKKAEEMAKESADTAAQENA